MRAHEKPHMARIGLTLMGEDLARFKGAIRDVLKTLEKSR